MGGTCTSHLINDFTDNYRMYGPVWVLFGGMSRYESPLLASHASLREHLSGGLLPGAVEVGPLHPWAPTSCTYSNYSSNIFFQH